ncbi:MAG: hypothetical protein H0T73_14410 [Ardenticatenales bacterium]|nr:hypothetical protein [Ardenticatenales bacterium]
MNSSLRIYLPLLLLLCLLLPACTPARTLSLGEQSEASVWTRPLNGSPVRQTLFLPAGTNEIEVILVFPDTAPVLDSRPLSWDLRDTTLTVLREGNVETAGYAPNTPLRLQFAPLPEGMQVELGLTAPQEAMLSLWASSTDQYFDGSLLDSEQGNNDLHFKLQVQETPLNLPWQLYGAAERWRKLALWIPLLLISPGWLLTWMIHPGGKRPIVPFVAGLSLALAPLVYLWASLLGLRLYEPLVQSLFQASALLLLLLMLRDLPRLRQAWQSTGRGSLLLVALVIVMGIATWLLAARLFYAPAGVSSLDSGLLAQELIREGQVEHLGSPLPLAVLTATLAQLSRQPLASMLLLAGLLLGVSLIPALYTVASEVAEDGWVGLWVVPLAWLWAAPWDALAQGDLSLLFVMVLLPTTFAVGLRALRVTERPIRTLLLASFPLAALGLLEGLRALVVVLVVLLWRLAEFYWQRRSGKGVDHEEDLDTSQIILRLLLWLLAAMSLLGPLLLKGSPLIPQVPLTAGYPLLFVTLLLAWLIGQIGSRLEPLPKRLLTVLLFFLLLPLVWWRSAPLPTEGILLRETDIMGLQWAQGSSQPDSLFLINVQVTEEGDVQPLDSALWLPLFGERPTILQREIDPALLARAMEPGALEDAQLRRELTDAGVTHLYMQISSGPLQPLELLGKEWVRLAYQAGDIYIFELPPPAPNPQG